MTRQWVKSLAELKRAQREAAIRELQEKERAAELERTIFERELGSLWEEIRATAKEVAAEFNGVLGNDEVSIRADDALALSIDRKDLPRKAVKLTLKAPLRQIGVQLEAAGVATRPSEVELRVVDGHLRLQSQEFQNGARMTAEQFAEEVMRRFLVGL